MAYKYGNRLQCELFPESYEDLIGENDSVRVYDAFVDSLNFNDLGFEFKTDKIGNSSYDPRAMVKLLLYSYSYGWRSSRKIERACHHNISFIWLTGGLKPDHKTIANFRRNNKKALVNIFKHSVRLCIKMDLIDGNVLFVDGTKIRGNASISSTWDEKRCKEKLVKIDKKIKALLKEVDKVDRSEKGRDSLVHPKALRDVTNLKGKVEKVLTEIRESEKKSMNSTDPDAVNFNGREGSHTGYNGQIVVDEKNGLIVNSDVVNRNNDRNEFSNQIKNTNEILGKNCKIAVADAGYSNSDEIKKIHDQVIDVIIPSQKNVQKTAISEFDKQNFEYNEDKDIYTCPTGKKLNHVGNDKSKNQKIYRINKKRCCKECEYFGICTKNTKGRHIKRLANESAYKKVEVYYKTDEGQRIYKQRKEKVELPFGHIKGNLKFRNFLLRGLDGVRAEFAMISTNFNITRMINLLNGTQKTLLKLS